MAMKRYDQKFKEEALKQSDDIGLKKASEQLNLNYGTLSGWRKQQVKQSRTKDVHRYSVPDLYAASS
jgi:transposase